MATVALTPPSSPLPAERFFRTSLSLLILTDIVMLTSTCNLDLITVVAAPLAAVY